MEAKPTVADMMAAYAQDAVDHAKASAGVTLDYSPDSVRHVEDVLEKAYEDVATLCKMYGGYIGEVVRRAGGGEWVIDTQIAPGQEVLSLRKGDAAVFPPAKVHKRLTNGAEDNVWFYFQVLMDKHWK
jgi:hypothetical protein